MDDEDQVTELISEIAAKHGIAVSRDDPILILQTINNRLMQDSAAAQQVQLDQYKQELEALALRWGNDAKSRAERILNASLSASKDGMRQIMEEGARVAVASVRSEMEAVASSVTIRVRTATHIAILNILASCLTLVAAGILLWTVTR